jgi:hypothetical protein
MGSSGMVSKQSVTADEAVLGLRFGMNVFDRGAAAIRAALLEARIGCQDLTDL